MHFSNRAIAVSCVCRFVPWRALSVHLLCQTGKASTKAHAGRLLRSKATPNSDRALSDTRPSRIDEASVAWMTGRTQLCGAVDGVEPAAIRADICRRCATRSRTRSIYKPQMISASVAASLASMAFSDWHIGPNEPSLSSRSRLPWSFFLATHIRPIPDALVSRAPSLSFGPGHIWRRTCKRKTYRSSMHGIRPR